MCHYSSKCPLDRVKGKVLVHKKTGEDDRYSGDILEL